MYLTVKTRIIDRPCLVPTVFSGDRQRSDVNKSYICLLEHSESTFLPQCQRIARQKPRSHLGSFFLASVDRSFLSTPTDLLFCSPIDSKRARNIDEALPITTNASFKRKRSKLANCTRIPFWATSPESCYLSEPQSLQVRRSLGKRQLRSSDLTDH